MDKNNKLVDFLDDKFEMQLEMSIDSESLSFFHFGCWGQDGCENKKPLKSIINKIKNDSSINFGIITGDNVYEHIQNNIKNYDKSILDNGIECLKQLIVPIFVAVGNHDIKNCNTLLDEIDKTAVILSQGRLSIDLEKSNWILPHNYYNVYLHLKGYDVNLIFIDTNLFMDSHEDCYFILENQTENRNIKLKKMLKWLDYILSKNTAKIVILIGHHYLFGYVCNPEIDNDDYLDKLPYVDSILDILNTHVRLKNVQGEYYYLCADIHNFQCITYTGIGIFCGLKINQIIGGVGGGTPDHLPLSNIGRIDFHYNSDNKMIGQVELIDKDIPYGYFKHIINSSDIISHIYVQTY
uniref:Calcineurin-like phosphoesterase domain-containing protein n=1 Tax=viral metagenome TaxID=1070528 RepID=A0A6C0LSD9_9ZZZZ